MGKVYVHGYPLTEMERLFDTFRVGDGAPLAVPHSLCKEDDMTLERFFKAVTESSKRGELVTAKIEVQAFVGRAGAKVLCSLMVCPEVGDVKVYEAATLEDLLKQFVGVQVELPHEGNLAALQTNPA